MTPEDTIQDNRENVQVRPQQFGLTQLLWLLAGFALLCAIFAPVVRQIPPENYSSVAIRVSFQFTLIAFYVWMAIENRRKRWKRGGRCLGYGRLRRVWWPHLLRLSKYVGIALGLAFQLLLLYANLRRSDKEFYDLGLTMAAGMPFFWAVTGLLDLRAIGATQIFENGVAWYFMILYPWDLLRVRRSKRYPGAIDVVEFPLPRRGRPSMRTMHVPEPLKRYLLEHHGIEAKANA